MFNRSIFRTSLLERMSAPEDLDELLQVNSVKMWLLLVAVLMAISGLVIWLFFSSITHQVKGFGLLKTDETPREILAGYPGQVDSVICKTGDLVHTGQKLIRLRHLSGTEMEYLVAPFQGKVSGVIVRESGFVGAGDPLIEVVRYPTGKSQNSEVVFFIAEQDVLKIKQGMQAVIKINKEEVPQEFLEGTITFVSDYPVPVTSIQKLFCDAEAGGYLYPGVTYFEARASLPLTAAERSGEMYRIIRSLNGSHCDVAVEVARKSPASFLFNLSH